MRIKIECPYFNGDIDIPEGYRVKKRGRVEEDDKVWNAHKKSFGEPEKCGGLVRDYWCVITNRGM